LINQHSKILLSLHIKNIHPSISKKFFINNITSKACLGYNLSRSSIIINNFHFLLLIISFSISSISFLKLENVNESFKIQSILLGSISTQASHNQKFNFQLNLTDFNNHEIDFIKNFHPFFIIFSSDLTIFINSNIICSKIFFQISSEFIKGQVLRKIEKKLSLLSL
jgi:hypothetical protein